MQDSMALGEEQISPEPPVPCTLAGRLLHVLSLIAKGCFFVVVFVVAFLIVLFGWMLLHFVDESF